MCQFVREFLRMGYVAFPRPSLNHEHPYFGIKVGPHHTYGSIYCHLLDLASYKQRTIHDYAARTSYLLERGELVISIRKLASQTKVNKSTLDRVLRSLARQGLIQVTRPDRSRLTYETPHTPPKQRPMNIITICYYDIIQRASNYQESHRELPFETLVTQSSPTNTDKTNELQPQNERKKNSRTISVEPLKIYGPNKTFDEVFIINQEDFMPEPFISRALSTGNIDNEELEDAMRSFYDFYWNNVAGDYQPDDWMAIWIKHCQSKRWRSPSLRTQ